jgi:hypothetical protein
MHLGLVIVGMFVVAGVYRLNSRFARRFRRA